MTLHNVLNHTCILGLGRFVSVSGVVLVDFFLFGGGGQFCKRDSLQILYLQRLGLSFIAFLH